MGVRAGGIVVAIGLALDVLVDFSFAGQHVEALQELTPLWRNLEWIEILALLTIAVGVAMVASVRSFGAQLASWGAFAAALLAIGTLLFLRFASVSSLTLASILVWLAFTVLYALLTASAALVARASGVRLGVTSIVVVSALVAFHAAMWLTDEIALDFTGAFPGLGWIESLRRFSAAPAGGALAVLFVELRGGSRK